MPDNGSKGSASGRKTAKREDWSTVEEQRLREILKNGASMKDAADVLGRSLEDVRARVTVLLPSSHLNAELGDEV